MTLEVHNETEMKELGAKIGARLHGGEVLELVGDVGAGKTTFTKGLAKGLGITEDVQSPTFTLSRVYDARDGLELQHYDFYRLPEPGILEHELADAVTTPYVVTVIEWSDIVKNVLPDGHVTFHIVATSENARRIEIAGDKTVVKAIFGQ